MFGGGLGAGFPQEYHSGCVHAGVSFRRTPASIIDITTNRSRSPRPKARLSRRKQHIFVTVSNANPSLEVFSCFVAGVLGGGRGSQASVPYFEMLETWIYHGDLNDQYGELYNMQLFQGACCRLTGHAAQTSGTYVYNGLRVSY